MKSVWGSRLKKNWPTWSGLIAAVLVPVVIFWPIKGANPAPAVRPRPSPYPADISRYIESAQRAAASGKRASALESLAKAQASHPNESALAVIATVYCDLKEYRMAAALLEPFIKEHPRNVPMRHRLALVYQKLKEYGHAVSILKRLSSEDSKNAEYLGDLGICNFLNGSKEEAAGNMRSAIRLAPERASAYLTLGAIYADQGRYEQALGSFDRALSLSPQPSDPLRQMILSSRSNLLAKKAESRQR